MIRSKLMSVLVILAMLLAAGCSSPETTAAPSPTPSATTTWPTTVNHNVNQALAPTIDACANADDTPDADPEPPVGRSTS